MSDGSARGREIGDSAWRGVLRVDASWLRDFYDFCNYCRKLIQCPRVRIRRKKCKETLLFEYVKPIKRMKFEA